MPTDSTRLRTLTPEQLRHARAASCLLRGAWDLGIAATDEDGRVMLGFAGLGVRAEVVGVAPQARGTAVQVSFMTRGEPFPSGWHDQVAGLGKDEDDAIDEAVRNWVAGPLDVLKEAYSSSSEYRYELPQVLVSGATVKWAVFEGPLQVEGPTEARREIVMTCEDAPPFTALAESQCVPELDPARPHVLKLYAVRRHDGSVEAEARFDGTADERSAAILQRFPFPASASVVSIRQYLVLRPLK